MFNNIFYTEKRMSYSAVEVIYHEKAKKGFKVFNIFYNTELRMSKPTAELFISLGYYFRKT